VTGRASVTATATATAAATVEAGLFTALRLGNTTINRLFLGSQEILKAYIGNTLVFSRAAAAPLLLDTYTGAILALSNRQLKSSTTNAVRARDSGDNSEADYTPAQITAGYTAIGADSGFAAKLYDQAGVVGELVQTTAANQMRVLNAGILETLNGKPAWNNTAGFGVRSAGNVSLSSYDEMWFFFVLETPAPGTNQIIFESSSNFVPLGSFQIFFPNNTTLSMNMRRDDGGGVRVGQVSIAETGRILISIRFIANTATCYEVYINGVSKTVSFSGVAAQTSNLTDQTVNLFARNAAMLRLIAKTQEGIIFSGNQSANRAAIEAEINSYYNIY